MPQVAAHRARKAVPRGPSVPAPVEAGAVAHELRAGWATMLPVVTPVQAARCCPPASHPGPLPAPPLPDSGRKSDGALGQKSAGPAGGRAPGTSLGEPAHVSTHELRRPGHGAAAGQPVQARHGMGLRAARQEISTGPCTAPPLRADGHRPARRSEGDCGRVCNVSRFVSQHCPIASATRPTRRRRSTSGGAMPPMTCSAR